MRILHAGWGFTPWRLGGLIRYAEDLMALQARRGHDVHYVCAGRRYPGLRAPRVKCRRRDGIWVQEIAKSPIPATRVTREPLRDLEDPWIERFFARLLGD